MFGLGVSELLIILVIVLVVFGAKRLPQLGAGVGGMIQGFRQAVRGDDQLPPGPRDSDRAR